MLDILITPDEIRRADAWVRVMTIPQLAAALVVPVRTVRQWVYEGRIPARQLGRKWQIPRMVIEIISARTIDD